MQSIAEELKSKKQAEKLSKQTHTECSIFNQ